MQRRVNGWPLLVIVTDKRIVVTRRFKSIGGLPDAEYHGQIEFQMAKDDRRPLQLGAKPVGRK